MNDTFITKINNTFNNRYNMKHTPNKNNVDEIRSKIINEISFHL